MRLFWPAIPRSPRSMGKLYRTPNVQFYDFVRADAYTRRFPYLTQRSNCRWARSTSARTCRPRPIHMVAPTAELVARDPLHPALSDLLIDAAREVHGKRESCMQRAGRIPCAARSRLPDQRRRRALLQVGQRLPVPRAAVLGREPRRPSARCVVVPLIVLLIPALRLVPSLYAVAREVAHLSLVWRADRDRAQRAQRAFGGRARVAAANGSTPSRTAVNGLKMPLAFADQFYVLREHIGFVRARLTQGHAAGARCRRRSIPRTTAPEGSAADIEETRRRPGRTARTAGKPAKAETDAAPNEAAEIGETRADERAKPD